MTRWNDIPLEAKVSFVYMFCGVIQRGLSFLTMPFFTRFLSTEQYGQVTIYTSWMSLLTIFLTLQLPYGSFFKAMVKFCHQRDEYVTAVEGICLGLSSLFLLVYIPFRHFWNYLFELPTFIILIMVFEIISNTIIVMWSSKKKFENKYKEVVVLTLSMAVLSLILQILFVCLFNEKGYARIIGSALVAIVFGGSLLIKSIIKTKLFYNKIFWDYALRFNIPLILYYLSQMVFNTSDRIMISHMVNKGAAAIYGVSYNIAFACDILLDSVNNTYIPWFYNKMEKEDYSDIKQVVNIIIGILSCVFLGVIWFAPEIIMLVAGKKYMSAIWTIPPVTISVLLLFLAQLSIKVLFFYEKKRMLVYASVISAVSNIILNWIFIPRCGWIAAGYTTFFSYLIFALINYIAARKLLKKEKVQCELFDIKTIAVIFLVFLFLSFLGMVFYNRRIIRVCFGIVLLVFIFAIRKVVMRYWHIIKNKNGE